VILKTRVIYYDLSEWTGNSKSFNLSPHKGVLAISVQYPNSVYRHIMSARDYYYVKDKEISIFDGGDKAIRIVKLDGVGKEKVKKVPPSYVDFAFLRMGVWVDDKTMEKASRRILERK